MLDVYLSSSFNIVSQVHQEFLIGGNLSYSGFSQISLAMLVLLLYLHFTIIITWMCFDILTPGLQVLFFFFFALFMFWCCTHL